MRQACAIPLHAALLLLLAASATARGEDGRPGETEANALLDCGEPVATLDAGGRVRSLAFSPDGTLLAAATCGTRTGWCVFEVAGRGRRIAGGDLPHGGNLVRFDGAGESLLVSSCDENLLRGPQRSGAAQVQSVRRGFETLFTGTFQGPMEGADLSPDGARLALGSHPLKVLDGSDRFSERSCPRELGGPAAFSPDGTFLVCLPANEVLVATAADPVRVVHRYAQAGVQLMDFSPDGRWLATGCLNGRLVLTDLRAGPREAFLCRYPNTMSSLAVSDAGGMCAMGFIDGSLHVRALRPPFAEMADIRPLEGLRGPDVRVVVAGLAFSPDGRYLAGTATSYGVQRVDALSTRETRSRKDVFLLAVGAGFAPCRALPIPRETTVSVFMGNYATTAAAVAFSRDGRAFAVGDEKGAIRLFRLPG
ncbi:MAG: hypothetical protein MUC63_00565 [Planctomycetes bacterium]|jgi:hypothetical protein|nr:hypothetical protein [Planctomycetota bacterium]